MKIGRSFFIWGVMDSGLMLNWIAPKNKAELATGSTYMGSACEMSWIQKKDSADTEGKPSFGKFRMEMGSKSIVGSTTKFAPRALPGCTPCFFHSRCISKE